MESLHKVCSPGSQSFLLISRIVQRLDRGSGTRAAGGVQFPVLDHNLSYLVPPNEAPSVCFRFHADGRLLDGTEGPTFCFVAFRGVLLHIRRQKH
jgi:hypothetical protein